MKHYPNGRNRFADVDELDEHMITEWNARIGRKDRVYHVGDFGGWDIEKSTKVLRRLNGQKFLVPGNHDKKHIKDEKFRSQWSMIYPYSYAEISCEGQPIVLCHFPIWEWMQIHRGWWHIHGHVHGKPTGIPGKILDVGVDGHNLLPWSWEEVVEHMANRPTRTHHEH
ncbi:metallophosphatase [Xanthomonas phage X1]|nr:metallophosphatase [Xanthomonas phage X1]